MKTNISYNDFVRAFEDCNRKNNFTHAGLRALLDYVEAYELETDTEITLDVIALCCEYTEYANMEEFWQDYDKDNYPTLEKLSDYTQVIPIEDTPGFIIQCF